ncbi:hypothetical protein [Streptomyces sp. SID12501]|uniref:HTH cro/C1-type domain-containing protein n=1 Tax=Streptomyces sp. SID12501 TaxID=2706042 RepID=A0A6B3BTH0_9ACTN|nr:hypothetical protein [Streptomyces sp. SID12501]NEC87655.1 hypothetical protein [Streptomyces sp. SID12501]
MGRKMNVLEDDGRPLAAFSIGLRKLREQAGNPTLTHLAGKSGYSQPRLSELFNAKKVPAEDLLRDVVTTLGGDADQWSERLRRLRSAEQDFHRATVRDGDSPQAQISRLELENKRLRELTEQPGVVIAQAYAAQESASRRMQAAARLERRASNLLKTAQEEYELLHERAPEAEKRAAAIIADGAATAARLELQGQSRHEDIVTEANRRADAIITRAQDRAREMLQNAEKRAKDHRATTYASLNKTLKDIDQLRVEAEQAVQQASAQRTSLEMRAKIEIERLVREAQQHLEKAGAGEQVHALDLLLLDFNITGSHAATRGRHARQTVPRRAALPDNSKPSLDLIAQPPGSGWTGWTFPQQRQPPIHGVRPETP